MRKRKSYQNRTFTEHIKSVRHRNNLTDAELWNEDNEKRNQEGLRTQNRLKQPSLPFSLNQQSQK